jgi:hypothetical protein
MTTGDAEVWTKLVDPSAAAGASDSEATSLAAGSAATIVIAGIESGPANPGDGWVARLDAAGAVVWRQSLRGGAAQDTLLATVAVNDLDQVFVAGRRRVALDGGVGLVPAIVKLSPAGVLSGSQASFGGPLREGSLRSVLTEPFQEVTVCLDSGGNVVVARLDVSFVVIGRQELTDPRGAIELGGCVGTSDGAILVVGTIGTATGPLAWSAKLDRSPLAIQWQRAIPTTGPARAVAVAADGAGGGWAVGSTPAPLRRWAATIAP